MGKIMSPLFVLFVSVLFVFCLFHSGFAQDTAPTTSTTTAATTTAATSSVPIEPALKIQPLQAGVSYDIPTAEETVNCVIATTPDSRGYIIKDGAGTILRKFWATPGSPRVNQFSFYKNGQEVYRETSVAGAQDARGNVIRDQFRWLQTGGSRIGVDQNADGVIDVWQAISPEEVTAEVCAAVITGDVARFKRVALTPAELESISPSLVGGLIGKQVAELEAKFSAAAAEMKLTKTTEWQLFRGSRPGTIPNGSSFGNTADFVVYEDTGAILQDGSENIQVSIGTLVKIGENNWRVIDVPKRITDENPVMRFAFFPPYGMPSDAAAVANVAGSTTPIELTNLINTVQTKTEQLFNTPPQNRAAMYADVVQLLEQAIALSSDPQDKEAWTRQTVDLISEAIHQGTYPDGVKNLAAMLEKAQSQNRTEQAAYILYKTVMSEYYSKIQNTDNDPAEVQVEWAKSLETLINDYEKTTAAAEAMMQLAAYRELSGRKDVAIRYYTRAAQNFTQETIGKRAAGAIRRLQAEGNVVPFKSQDANGKPFDIANFPENVIVLYFWASWSNPDPVAIKAVQDKYSKNGVLVIGVNLDTVREDLAGYLQRNPMQMPQLFEPGGLESPTALYWGIQNVPAIIVYDKKGKVLSQGLTTAAELDKILGAGGP